MTLPIRKQEDGAEVSNESNSSVFFEDGETFAFARGLLFAFPISIALWVIIILTIIIL